MAATRPQQKLKADCILAAQAAAGLAGVEQRTRADISPARELGRQLAKASANWPGQQTAQDRRLLWAVPLALRQTEPLSGPETARTALQWSQKIDSAAKGELPPAAVKEAKLFCLRLSDALGLKSKSLNF